MFCAIIQKLSNSTTEFGGIAQLGERLNGIQEVSGSIPLISTRLALKTIGFQGFFFSYGAFVAGVQLVRRNRAGIGSVASCTPLRAS